DDQHHQGEQTQPADAKERSEEDDGPLPRRFNRFSPEFLVSSWGGQSQVAEPAQAVAQLLRLRRPQDADELLFGIPSIELVQQRQQVLVLGRYVLLLRFLFQLLQQGKDFLGLLVLQQLSRHG